MAKNKNKNATSDNINKNQIKSDKASNETDIFAASADEVDDKIVQEIEKTLKDGSYNKNSEISPLTAGEEGADAVVFHSQDVIPANSPNQKEKKAKKRKPKKNYEKTTFLHKMKVLGVLLVLGVFTGSGLGVWYFNVNLRINVGYADYNPADYILDTDNLLKSKFNISSKAEKDNWLNYVGSSTPENFTPAENLALAIHNATTADTFLFTGNGSSVAMGVTQTVYSLRRFDGQTYAFESISKGMLSIANLDVYKQGSSKVDIYTGTSISQRNAKWKYSKTVSSKEYNDLTGSLPSGITPYIISDKTIKSVTKDYDATNGHYIFTFNLNPITSALYYYKEMKRTGALEADPEFKSINYTAVMDEHWNLIYTEVFEEYDAIKLGLRNKCKGTIKIEYQFNCDVEMPKI